MKFHKEGYTSMALCILLILIMNVLVEYFYPGGSFGRWVVYSISVFLFVVILQFFRSPSRAWVRNDDWVIAPADGKIVVVEEVFEPEYFKDQRIQVSIFMSPVNVHVNRNPITGLVRYFRYYPGKYLVAYHPKASTKNERTSLVIEHFSGTQILMRQIAGLLARRIVWYVKPGQLVVQTDEFGFIKFGSRVDIFLPLGMSVRVKVGDVVKGGMSVIAELN